MARLKFKFNNLIQYENICHKKWNKWIEITDSKKINYLKKVYYYALKAVD